MGAFRMNDSLPLLISLSVAICIPVASRTMAEGTPVIVLDSKFELFVSDATDSASFYRVLGFEIVQAKPYGYTTLRSGATIVALSPLPWWLPVHWLGFLRHPPIGTEIVFYTGQLEQSRAALLRSGYSPSEIKLQSWGDRDYRVTDPDGYYVRVSEGGVVEALR
jgi:catechol 2,3-dioxygenase-like lactoylglutathione lyase family enzyme